jgi:hypothetical protein
VRLNPPTDPNPNPVDHFLTSVNDLFEHVLQDVLDLDMVGNANRNENNQSDKLISKLGNVSWSVFESEAGEFPYQCPQHFNN